MDNKLAVREKVNAETASLDAIVVNSLTAIRSAVTPFSKALAVGRAYIDVKGALMPQMKFVTALSGQANGFKVDKKDYPEDVIKTCAIDALIAGVQLTGNQFNIIAGNMYITQNGWRQKLIDLQDFSFRDVARFDPPRTDSGTTVVKCRQAYFYQGAEFTFEYDAMIRSSSGATIDNIVGKAKAKLWHALYDKLTGEVGPYHDDAVEEVGTGQGQAKRNLSIASVTAASTNGTMFPDTTPNIDAIKGK